MKILDVLYETADRNTQQSTANQLRKLYDKRVVLKNAMKEAMGRRSEGAIDDLDEELQALEKEISSLQASLNEGKNHMGDREYQTYGSWKSACKKAYPGCTFRGDKDIGAAVLNGHDVGEWDGVIGNVYTKQVSEAADDFSPREVEYLVSIIQNPTADISPEIMSKLMDFYSDEMPYGTQKARTGDPYDWIATRLEQIYNRGGDDGIRNEFGGINESIDHKEMLRGLQKALTKASADLKEMEDDLRVMKGTARTEEEHDAVDDYTKTVEKKRALVERLKKRVKLRKAALGDATINESAREWEDYETEELFDIVSDYYKDVHGHRPRNIGTREEALSTIHALDKYIDQQKSTPEGRKRLEAEGWYFGD